MHDPLDHSTNIEFEYNVNCHYAGLLQDFPEDRGLYISDYCNPPIHMYAPCTHTHTHTTQNTLKNYPYSQTSVTNPLGTTEKIHYIMQGVRVISGFDHFHRVIGVHI